MLLHLTFQSEIIELKRRRKHKDRTLPNLMEKWLPQLAKYLFAKEIERGYMFVFDLGMEDAQMNQSKQQHIVGFEGKNYTVFVYFFK